jgi:arginine exporter protein ArgO
VPEVVLSGLVTGWAIAVPVGAVGAFLVSLTARTSLAVGAAAALGVAAVDGAYAATAVIGGAALAALVAPVADALQVASAIVLLVVATVTLVQTLRSRTPADGAAEEIRAGAMSPARAFVLFVSITAINPATVAYFAAVVLGNQDLVEGFWQGTAFVLAAFAASASWQLTLAGGGAALAGFVTSRRGHLVTGIASAAVIAGLALLTLRG